MNEKQKQDFLNDFKIKQDKEVKNKNHNFIKKIKTKKNKNKNYKKGNKITKWISNISFVLLIIFFSGILFAMDGFNKIADKEYLARIEELQNLSEKSNMANFATDIVFIQFLSKNSNTIIFLSLALLIFISLLAITLNLTIFKEKNKNI